LNAVRLGTDALDHATLGVFFRLQIPDFDLFFGFLSLCHFIFPSYLFCCSAEEQPPLIPAQVWGGDHFLIKKSDHRYRAALRDRTNNAVSFIFDLYVEVSLVMLATLNLVTLDVRPRADVGCHHAALGVFFRFHVADFDRLLGFFSLCHFIFPSYLFCCSGEEQPPLIPAQVWGEVIF
jgi:hypothetical protein